MESLKTKILTLIIFSLFFNSVLAKKTGNDNRLNTAENVNYLSPFEKEIIYEINLFRSNPSQYAKNYIAPLSKNYKGKMLYYPNDKPLKTKEGVRALNECVRELKKAKQLSIVYPKPGLTKAAEDHVNDQSKTGKTGHYGKDRSNAKTRIERYGEWHERIAENIAYGGISARQIVIYLLVDDGVYNRGHRKNFLIPEFKTVGVASGYHPEYETMCVIELAGSFTDN